MSKRRKQELPTAWCGARVAHRPHMWPQRGPWTGSLAEVKCDGTTHAAAAAYLAAWRRIDPREDVVK